MCPFYSHICAVAENNTIGLKGNLPWNIPEDLRFFKEKTQRKIIIMGRKTFESLGQALPDRLNIVISQNLQLLVPKNVLLCPSLQSAYRVCETIEKKLYGREVFIIGGGEIYRQSFSQTAFIYLTRIHKQYPGDAFYPAIPTDEFQEINRKDREGTPPYSFITYARKEV